MQGHDIIVIGASAGGVEALPKLLGKLPKNLPASVFVVLHISYSAIGFLPNILSRSGGLKADHASGGEVIRQGKIYVAPPDHHLLIERGRMLLSHGEKENRHRPAVDPLFRSAANAYGPRVVGVILTGSMDDGTRGLDAIKKSGGVAIVQNPEEAFAQDMPLSALRNVEVDYVLSLAKIPGVLARLAKTPINELPGRESKRSGGDPVPVPKKGFQGGPESLNSSALFKNRILF